MDVLFKLAAATAVDEQTGTWATWRKGESSITLCRPGQPAETIQLQPGESPQGAVRTAVLRAVGGV